MSNEQLQPGQLQQTQQPAAGWYPDGHGTVRWWDGYNWTNHVQQPQAQQGMYQVQERRQLADDTPVDNGWVWVVSLASFVLAPAVFTLDLRGYTNSLITGEPTGIINYFLWLGVMTVLGWGVTALCIVAAYKDHKRLVSLGVVRPFHWAFAFLGTTVYLIGRHVVLRKVMRTPGWPLWAHVAALGLYLIVTIWWTIWLTQGLISDAMYYEGLYS